MVLAKLKSAVTVVPIFGAIMAGAVLLAQPAGGRRQRPELPAATRPPSQDVSTPAGNWIVDWFPAERNAAKREVTVDAVRHCVHLANVSVKREFRPNDGVLRLDVEQGKTYKVTAAGEAFMSDHTGSDADPFPGAVLLYGVDDAGRLRHPPGCPGSGTIHHLQEPLADRPAGRRGTDGILPGHLAREPQPGELHAHRHAVRRLNGCSRFGDAESRVAWRLSLFSPDFLVSSRSPYGGVSCRCKSGRGNRLFARVVIVDVGMG